MKITRKQIRQVLKESLLFENEMQDIIVNEYEDVEDYNILANYALANDIQGALADPAIKPYVDKNEIGWISDEAGGWFETVGEYEDDGGPAPPEGWDAQKAYKFLRDLEDAAWKVYSKQMDSAIAADPDKEFLEYLGNQFTSTIAPDDMPGIKWKEYKKYMRLKPPPSISHGVGEITINKEDYEYNSGKPGTWDEFKDFLTARAGGDAGRRPAYKRSPPPLYD